MLRRRPRPRSRSSWRRIPREWYPGPTVKSWFDEIRREKLVGGGRIQGALLSGLIAIVIALIITYCVSLVIPTTELTWALIAVGIGAVISAVAGCLSGASERSGGDLGLPREGS